MFSSSRETYYSGSVTFNSRSFHCISDGEHTKSKEISWQLPFYRASSDSIPFSKSIRKPFQSDIHDYLANLSVGFEEARRFLDLFKRKRACDDGLQLPRSEPAGNEGFCTL